MKNTKNQFDMDYLSVIDDIKMNKVVKTVAYIGVGIAVFYLLGKTFSIFASTVRGYNDLKSAYNGN